MTLTIAELGLYSFAVFVLFLTPGPVWVALLARAMSGGFKAAWPLALGVTVGDLIWPLLAILGVSWLVAEIDSLLTIMKWVAAAMFLIMGVMLLRSPGTVLGQDSRLMRPGMWAGFVAGVLVILGNPKAVLFYMGLLPGFFDLSAVTWVDIAAILGVSMAVPLAGNLILAGCVSRVRQLMESPTALRRLNVASGVLLICVGLVIPVT